MPGKNSMDALLFSDKVQLASCAISGLLLFVTIISVICAFLVYRHQKNRAKKASACDLAKYYAENIIQKLSVIGEVYENSELTEPLHQAFPIDEISAFDKEEMLNLLRRFDKTSELFKKLMDIKPDLILQMKIRTAATAAERAMLSATYLDEDPVTGEKKIINAESLKRDFSESICLLLNELEWFSMNCRYGIVDEEILYQSLHQTFLSTVWFLYFHISAQNESNEDKLFTNTIWLFGEWKKRLKKIQGKAEKDKKKAIKKYEAAEKEAKKAKERAGNIQPKVHAGKPLH